MKPRLGGDADYDEQPQTNGDADLAGIKRQKREYSDEEEDMDFEAIQNQNGF